MRTNYVHSTEKESSPFQNILETVRALISLTKPRIIILLSITGIVGFLIASQNSFSLLNLLIAIIIGYLSAGGAMTVNSYIDRDIDVKMDRTSSRATVNPNNLISPPEKILFFGFLLITFSLLLSIITFNLLTAFFVSWGVFYYLIGYSLVLKRKSVVNTLLGGLASPAPVWMGYAAVLGYVPIEGWLLGFLVFIWTPSHTWSLATHYVDDYRKASIPMLPVVYGIPRTSQITFIWGIFVILYGTFVVYWMTNGSFGNLVLLIIPHLILFYGLFKFLNNPSPETAYRSFKLHNIWLALVFLSILIPI